ncbi:MAG: hypothetical protein P8O96_02815 [Flavobacteriaceae bacterium]|nr:hypothetical protein [Flavobacteriaceae bacterium]MDA9028773.1 hypothetical protein [Flavobacteriaceae bacterium]MDC1259929.1 hypothetical protein [Flavobacteriaceae bacterium]MDG1041762.1 hypothetical protein [Flavobacteriaceae bacterium]MDG1384792.1 hypothetical protein [Flavobacteriaceae bacterium]
MKNKLLCPAIGISLVAFVCIIINECTDYTVNTNFAYMLIVSAMLFGFWRSKRMSVNKK